MEAASDAMMLANDERPADSGRRRILKLVAASAAATVSGAAFPAWSAAAAGAPHRWEGRALGADASILLYHPSATEAQRLIETCVAEIKRLEAVFSLYRPDSALSQLNAAGALDDPPRDLVELLQSADSFRLSTNGAFDVTVQPLWTLLADYFASGGVEGPAPDAVDATLSKVGGADIRVATDRVAFAKPGMAATFNGIAQGYITDRVANILKSQGMANVLLDLGEYRAIGGRPSGEPWRLGVADAKAPWKIVERLSIRDRAVATSSRWGTAFDDEARFNHLLDPRTGASAFRYISVTVTADDAVTADALSTALSLSSPEEARRIVAAYPGVEALLRMNDRKFLRLGT